MFEKDFDLKSVLKTKQKLKSCFCYYKWKNKTMKQHPQFSLSILSFNKYHCTFHYDYHFCLSMSECINKCINIYSYSYVCNYIYELCMSISSCA